MKVTIQMFKTFLYRAPVPGYPLYLFIEARSKKKNKKQDSIEQVVLLLGSCLSCFYKKDAATIPGAIPFSKYNPE